MIDGYIVIDTDTGALWRAQHKQVWVAAAHAKNAWNVGTGRYRQENGKPVKNPTFNEQTRYVVRPIRFIDQETGHYFT